MKAKKRNVIAILASCVAFSAIGLTAASCGKPEDDGSLKIVVWNTFNQHQTPLFKTLSDTFRDICLEEYGEKVRIISRSCGGYDTMQDQIIDGFQTNDIPNIAVAYPDNVATYIHKEKKAGEYIVNLGPLMNDPEIGFEAEPSLNELGVDDFVPAFLDEGTHYINEGIYSLPYEKSSEILMYRKNPVKKAMTALGITDQSVENYMDNITWQQFLEIANYINDNRKDFNFEDDVKNKLPKYVLFYDSDSNLLLTQMFQRDIPYISLNNGEGSLDFVNDQAAELVKELHTAHKNGLLCTKASEGTYGSNYFKSKRSIFTVGSSGGANYNAPESSGVDDPVGVCKVPFYQEKIDEDTYIDIPEERQKFVSQGVTLTLFSNPALDKETNAKKILYSWRFLKYITNTDNTARMCLSSNGYVPPRYSAYENILYNKFLNKNSFLSQCSKLVINELDGKYFNYPVFHGSKYARDEMTSLLKKAFLEDTLSLEDIKGLFTEAENQVKLKMNQ